MVVSSYNGTCTSLPDLPRLCENLTRPTSNGRQLVKFRRNNLESSVCLCQALERGTIRGTQRPAADAGPQELLNNREGHEEMADRTPSDYHTDSTFTIKPLEVVKLQLLIISLRHLLTAVV